jgi:hypothetical protein
VQRVFPVKGTVLVEFKFFLGVPPVLFGGVVFPLTFTALQGHQFHRGLFTRHMLPLPVKIRVNSLFWRLPPEKASKQKDAF